MIRMGSGCEEVGGGETGNRRMIWRVWRVFDKNGMSTPLWCRSPQVGTASACHKARVNVLSPD